MVTALGVRGFELVLSPGQILGVTIAGGIVGGVGAATLTYVLRWELPKNTAAVRAQNIDEGMVRTVAFMYALSRGDVAFPKTVETLANNDEMYGESAREMTVTVREMDLFGRDMITAVRQMAARTPSEEFKSFAENLSSVLQSGQRLPDFLHEQYGRYREEAADRQDEILELLATIAEAYVTVLVAGVLFLITILLVFGLTTTDTFGIIQLVGYVLVPLANAGFMVYLAQKLKALGIQANSTSTVSATAEMQSPARPVPSRAPRPDGVATELRRDGLAQLALYDRIGGIMRVLRSPSESVLWHPTRLLYVTVPIAILFLAIRVPSALTSADLNVRSFDDVVVQATLFVLGSFAIVRTLYTWRVRRIAAATPEFLERLASLNEAGMTLVESLDRLRDSDVGVLSTEVDRIWTDVTMGSTLDAALVRFGRRVRTTSIARVVTLLTNAMRASGALGSVLRIAATQTRADERLRRRRRQQMFAYLVVIYISFAVFLVIIVAVHEVLIPALPSHVPTPDNADRLGINVDQFARFGQVDKAAYMLVFFHTALIHAVLSGFTGGMLGEGAFRDGAKHAAVMLAIAYAVFLLLSSPVASITMDSPAPGEDVVTVDSASLSEGGYIVFHLSDSTGTVIGHSAYLGAGTHKRIEVPLERQVQKGQTLVVVAHLDTDGDETQSLDSGTTDHPYSAPGKGEIVRIEVDVGRG